MSVETIGIINRQINIEEVLSFLEENQKIKKVNYNKNFSYLDNCCYYSVGFNYSKCFIGKCEKRILDIHIYDNSEESLEELKEKYHDGKIDLDKFNNGYTCFHLNSWGKSSWLMISLLNYFHGYLIPNDHKNNKIYYIDQNTNQEDIDLNDAAYLS